MSFFGNVQELISTQLIREISVQIMEMHSHGFAGASPQEGITLLDSQGIAILAEDKGNRPLVFCFSIPVPLTVDAGRDLLSLCEKACDRIGLDETDPGKMLLGCFELLNELITNGLAASKISGIVGAYHVRKLLNAGINLEEQVKINECLALKQNVEAKFSIIKDSKLIYFDGDIGPRERLGRTV